MTQKRDRPHKEWEDTVRRSYRILSRAVAVLAAVTVVGSGVRSASAIPTDPSDNPCISDSTFGLTISRPSVVWGQSVVLTATENAAPVANCSFTAANSFIQFTDKQSNVTYSEPFSFSDKLIPPATGRYDLVVVNNANVYHVASVDVTLSAFPVVAGHPYARIIPGTGSGDQAATFEQAVQQPGARVYIQGDVNLDLSGMANIHVARDVQIIGERNASHPRGPRLFTTTFPANLLLIGDPDQQTTANDVRITGIVLDGGEPSDPCESAGDGVPGSNGITVYASQHVQIDHSELFHWRGAAISVQDNDDVPGQSLPSGQPHDAISRSIGKAGVWVYSNYIHDNQHPTFCGVFGDSGLGLGYGVVVSQGGFPLIQGNVFDSDRHAIAGHGSNGDGYTAVGNLFLKPGLNKWRLSNYLNPPIDMHGLQTCPNLDGSWNCGQGGLYMEVANNIVVGDGSDPPDASAIKLRGRPTNTDVDGVGMFVHDNVFNGPQSGMLIETLSTDGMVVGPGNAFVPAGAQRSFALAFSDPSSQGPSCDFDGDGTSDAFRNSAGTFWYYSSRVNHWVYMTTNNVTDSLRFADSDGDRLCDVYNTHGVVYRMPPSFESFPLFTTVPSLNGMTQATAEDAIAAAGLKLDTVVRVVSLNAVGSVVNQSLPPGSGAQAGSLVVLTVSAGGVILPNLTGLTEANARSALANAGLTAGTVTHDMNSATRGTVYTQDPAAGASGSFVLVAPGAAVSFGVSLGSASVPNVVGDTDSQARQAIANAGLTVGRVSHVNNCVDTGTVQTQNPLEGVSATPGSGVNYTLSTCTGTGSGPGGGGGGSGGGPILPK